VFDALLDARRYAEIAAENDLVEAVDRLFAAAGAEKPVPEEYDKPEEYEAAVERHYRYYSGRIGEYYQVLFGLGRDDEADALAARLLEKFPGASSLNALAWAGYLTGHPGEKHLQQAREADELTFHDNAAILDTLARILAVRGQREEAVKLVSERIAVTNNKDQIALLRDTLEAVEAQRPNAGG
jgi:hypothetical protein